MPDTDCDLIVSDSASGARLVEHLIAVGHRHIAHITDAEDTSTGRERLRGYREALEQAGTATGLSSSDHRRSARRLSRDPDPRPRSADRHLHGQQHDRGRCDAGSASGAAVPRDIGLVCFDDVEHLAVLSPFLTVVDQPAETFGSLGAQLLLERISGKAGTRSRRIVLQTDLVVRESCCVNTGVPARPNSSIA